VDAMTSSSDDCYPDLWVRARRFMDSRHPEIRAIPSKDMLIHLLLKELGL
jgi:hypothetical protein